MGTPVNRMAEHYGDTAIASTIAYVDYCTRRNFPDGRVKTVNREPIVGDCIEFGITMDWSDQAFIVRFRVPIDATEAVIKQLCQDASLAMLDMVVKAGMKVK